MGWRVTQSDSGVFLGLDFTTHSIMHCMHVVRTFCEKEKAVPKVDCCIMTQR